MDQYVAQILIPIAILIAPSIGCCLGIQQRSPLTSFFVAWGGSILLGIILGAFVAAIVDYIASRMPGGNPWIGHPTGISFGGCFLGSCLIGGVSSLSGIVAGAVSSLVVYLRSVAAAAESPHVSDDGDGGSGRLRSGGGK